MHNFLVETPEGYRPLTRPKCRWEASMKIDLVETVSNGEYWCHPDDKKDK
jgi:hypothetical protein